VDVGPPIVVSVSDRSYTRTQTNRMTSDGRHEYSIIMIRKCMGLNLRSRQ